VKSWKLPLLALFYLLYGFFYIGWFIFDSDFPWLRVRNSGHVALLLLLAIPMALPPAILYLRRKLGWKHTIFALTPVTLIVGLLYAYHAFRYYYTANRLFDPFLQSHLNRFDLPKQRTPGSFRVLALGGSTTYNVGVPPRQNYPYWVQLDLQRQYPSVRIEVLNEGQPWFTTRHSLIAYTTYARDWQPDLVIMMSGLNDISRSFSPRQFAFGSYDDLYTHFFGAAARGALPQGFLPHLITDHMSITFEWHKALRNRNVDYDLSRYYSVEPFEGNIRKLIHYARADDSKVLLVTEPSLYKENMTHKERVSLWFGDIIAYNSAGRFRRLVASPKSLMRAMQEFNGVTKRIAQSENLPLVEADQMVEKNLTNFVDDVHPTADGARIVGEAVARKIIDLGMVPQTAGTVEAKSIPRSEY
jgi:lysophospholipase L1-like esterase